MKLFVLSLLVGILEFSFLLKGVQAQKPEDCLVTTRLGLIQGKVELSRNGKRYCSYLGIPYSNSPKRFEVAELGGPWTGIKDATKYGAWCPQWATYTEDFIGDENCLFVNVHYPIDDQCHGILNRTNELLPVLAHIHGGGTELGSGAEYGPKYLMDHCTVVFSMNYRLGALGFLTTNDGLIPSNLGFKDVVLSLRWNQQNIDSFGGDPNSITLIGISSGSSIISRILTSPTAEGLFHRAIAQSGPALTSILTKKNPNKAALALSKRLKCDVDESSSSADLKKCLLAASAKDIVDFQRFYVWSSSPGVSFGAVVENQNTSNPLQTVNPLYKLIAGNFIKVPLIMGFTEDEGVLLEAFSILSQPELVKDLNTRWEEIAPISLNYDEDYIPQELKNKFSRKIRNYYFGDKDVGQETAQSLINLHSDRYFVQGVFDTVELYSRYAPVYPYVFSYKKGYCLVCEAGYPVPVSTHGTDIQYLFTYEPYPEIEAGTASAEFSDRLIKLWLTFARTGNPSETWPTKNLWKPYKNDGVNPYNWYKIDEEISELKNYLKDRREFWKHLGLRTLDNPVDF